MNADSPTTDEIKYLWRGASFRLLPCFVIAVIGAAISDMYGNVRTGSLSDKLLALIGVLLFLVFAVSFLRILTGALTSLMAMHAPKHLNVGRVGAVRFLLRMIGYVVVVLITLELVGVPVGNLLLGGAALGIILGVAAQQALANFFASIVLIISHPYSVGDHITFRSGALGGEYTGRIKDIGLTHTRLVDDVGNIVLLPNATMLSGASVTITKATSKS